MATEVSQQAVNAWKQSVTNWQDKIKGVSSDSWISQLNQHVLEIPIVTPPINLDTA